MTLNISIRHGVCVEAVSEHLYCRKATFPCLDECVVVVEGKGANEGCWVHTLELGCLETAQQPPSLFRKLPALQLCERWVNELCIDDFSECCSSLFFNSSGGLISKSVIEDEGIAILSSLVGPKMRGSSCFYEQ